MFINICFPFFDISNMPVKKNNRTILSSMLVLEMAVYTHPAIISSSDSIPYNKDTDTGFREQVRS